MSDKLRGHSVDFGFVDEAGQIDEEAFEKLAKRFSSPKFRTLFEGTWIRDNNNILDKEEKQEELMEEFDNGYCR